MAEQGVKLPLLVGTATLSGCLPMIDHQANNSLQSRKLRNHRRAACGKIDRETTVCNNLQSRQLRDHSKKENAEARKTKKGLEKRPSQAFGFPASVNSLIDADHD